MATTGDLRVWWIPQVPGKPFYADVRTLREAMLLLQTLAAYDLFQFDNRIKPDYCNTGGLLMFDASDKEDSPDGSWTTWYDDETGKEVVELTDDELAARS